MWFGSSRVRILEKALESIFARLEHLETAPIQTLPQVELSAHEGLQARVSAIESLPTPESADADRITACESNAQSLLSAVKGLADQQEDMKLAISEGIERVDRAERRIRSSVARARKQLADRGLIDEGLEAEDASIREGDGEAGDRDGVQPVPEDVDYGDEDYGEESSIPGVPLSVVQRIRGIS